MEIRLFQESNFWGFVIVATSNGTIVAESCRAYASRRNALAAAKLIAKSKFKVVEA